MTGASDRCGHCLLDLPGGLLPPANKVAITHDALDLTVQAPQRPRHGPSSYRDPWSHTPPGSPSPDMGPTVQGTPLDPGPPSVTSDGQDWRHVQTLSFEDVPTPVLTSGGY